MRLRTPSQLRSDLFWGLITYDQYLADREAWTLQVELPAYWAKVHVFDAKQARADARERMRRAAPTVA